MNHFFQRKGTHESSKDSKKYKNYRQLITKTRTFSRYENNLERERKLKELEQQKAILNKAFSGTDLTKDETEKIVSVMESINKMGLRERSALL